MVKIVVYKKFISSGISEPDRIPNNKIGYQGYVLR